MNTLSQPASGSKPAAAKQTVPYNPRVARNICANMVKRPEGLKLALRMLEAAGYDLNTLEEKK